MGTFVDTLFSALMSWVRALVSALWALMSSERTTALEFLAKNWLGIAALLIVVGLVADWLVWLVKWQPYHIWAMRVRRLFGGRDEEDEDDEEAAALAAYRALGEEEEVVEAAFPQEDEGLWMPLSAPQIDEEEAQEVLGAAAQVPDEDLGQYPGMRYDSSVAGREPVTDTRRFGAVHTEGPGAQEVNKRRAEIDAWQRQMQEEARARAQAERAAREEAARAEAQRRAEEARKAEEARLAREREEARIRAEAEAKAAYETEQVRLAQEAYQRELEEYERKMEQYRRDLAAYEQQKAAYEASLAKREEACEFAGEIRPEAPRRRRQAPEAQRAQAHAANKAPEAQRAPAVKKAPAAKMPAAKPAPEAHEQKPARPGILRGGMARMAQMIEPENEDVTGIASLPPRVDRDKAYRPAKRPAAQKRED